MIVDLSIMTRCSSLLVSFLETGYLNSQSGLTKLLQLELELTELLRMVMTSIS